MASTATNEHYKQLKRDVIVIRDQVVEFADTVLRLIDPDWSQPGSSKNDSGLSDAQRAKLLRKRRENVQKSLLRKNNNKAK